MYCWPAADGAAEKGARPMSRKHAQARRRRAEGKADPKSTRRVCGVWRFTKTPLPTIFASTVECLRPAVLIHRRRVTGVA